MAGQGAHIILRRDDAKRLFAQADDAGVKRVVNELLHSKEHREENLVLESGEYWDPIHRSLNNGTLDPQDGEFPLDHCILGGRRLHKGAEFEAILVRPDIVTHVASALHTLKREEFRERYFALDPASYGKQPTEKEFELIWNRLHQIRQLFEDAAADVCAVLFTVPR